MYVFIFLVKVTEWPPIGKIAAHSACDMFHGVNLVFSHLGFWSGNLFLIAPFPDLCLLVPFFFFFSIYVHIHLYNPRMGADGPWYLFFQNQSSFAIFLLLFSPFKWATYVQ